MPFSRSRSIESMTRSATSWFARKAPDCQSMASTKVVLPWSTWAMMATLRRSVRCDISHQWYGGIRRMPSLGRIRGSSSLFSGTRGKTQSRKRSRMLLENTTFASLGLSPELVAALDEAGITEPFPIQAMTGADALAGHDVCGKAKTGSGKTLAFGLPSLERTSRAKAEPGHPTALVLVPTRELAAQVRDVLKPLGAAI